MTADRLTRTVFAFGVIAATLVSSVLALIALNAGGSVGLGDVTILEIAAGKDRRAETLLSPSNMMRRSSRAEAAELSREAIALYPYDTSAWLRLAFVDSLDHGALTPAGLSYLRRSYDLVAVDVYVGLWRVRFALENSTALTPELRASARNEVAALWRNEENRPALRQMASSINNPAGRLSMALWLNRLESAAGR